MAENKDIIKLSSLIVDNQPINETNFVPDTVELSNEVSNYKPIKISDFKKTIIVVDEIQENGNYQPETCQNAYDPNKVSMYVDQQKNETLMSNYYTIEEIEEILSGKTNIDSVYTKDETYNKNEVYNVGQIDFLLKLKVNKVDVYSKIDMNTLLDLKANKNEIYDKNEIDEILCGYYTKLDIDTILENKADIEDVIAISGQVLTNIEDIEYLETNKQDKLIAGENITISGNVISVSDNIELNDYLKKVDASNTYETIENVQILSDIISGQTQELSDLQLNKQDKLISGENITISGNVISADDEIDPAFNAWKIYYNQYLTALLEEQPNNPASKYLNALRQWIEIVVGSGGYQAPLYLTTINSITSGFRQLSYTPELSGTTLTTTVRNESKLVRRYIYDQQIGVTAIDSGNWVVSGRYMIDATIGITRLKYIPFLYHLDGTTTELFTFYSDEINNTEYLDIQKQFPYGTIYCLETDRLGIDIYIETTSQSTRTFSALIGDGNPAYIVTPLRLKHNQLRGLNDDPLFQHLTEEEKALIFSTAEIVSGNTEDISNLYINKADKSITLSGYGITDAYTKTEIDNKISAVFRYKGSVPTYVDLIALTGMTVGDVYNVTETGDNYAWTGTLWDKLSGEIDLSAYLTIINASNTYETITNVNLLSNIVSGNTEDIADLQANKADKATTLSGYGITDAYTKTEINNKLNNNYTYKILNTVVSSWSTSTSYINYKYEATINIANLVEGDFVNVVFGGIEASNGNYAPIHEQYDGYVKIFSKVNNTITIPTIVVTKILL